MAYEKSWVRSALVTYAIRVTSCPRALRLGSAERLASQNGDCWTDQRLIGSDNNRNVVPNLGASRSAR
jgi:hypothetical protein